MKPGDLVYAADKTAFQTLYEGVGILVRPDEGRTYVAWSEAWEVFFPELQTVIVIDGLEIEVLDGNRIGENNG